MSNNMFFISNALNLVHILSCILFVVLLVLIVKAYFLKLRFAQQVNKLPSSKLRWYEFFGHAYGPLKYMFRRSSDDIPFTAYIFMRLNAYQYIFPKENITFAWLFNYPVLAVYKADSVEMVMNSSKAQNKAWVYRFMKWIFGTGLLLSEGELNKNRRKLLTPAFHVNILKDFISVFTKNSNILKDVLNTHTEDKFVDIISLISRCSFDNVCQSILGMNMHTQQTQVPGPFLNALSNLGKGSMTVFLNPLYWHDFCRHISPFCKKRLNDVAVIKEFTDKLISDKKKAKMQCPVVIRKVHAEKEDKPPKRKTAALMDLFLEHHLTHNTLSVEDIRDEVNTFTLAAQDTTSMAMSWILYMIGLHPWVQQKIHEELDFIFGEDDRDAAFDDINEMKYMDCVIKESLRLYTPVPIAARNIEEDIEFQGRTLPKGSTMLVMIYTLHRDPEVFQNPEKFDPERFTPENSAGRHPYAFVPFLVGPRNCIGQKFAMLEIKAVLSTILRTFKIRSLDPRDKVICSSEIVLQPLKKLRIQVRKRDQEFDFHSVYYFQ